MIAVLLNSGIGSRMGDLTRDIPKCMVEVSPGKTIISMQIDTLRANGIEHFVITTGHMAGVLQKYLTMMYPDLDIFYVYNEKFKETNYIVSLNNAAEILDEDILLLHGDLVFSDGAARAVLQAPGSTVVVDSTAPIPEKDFKARIAPGGNVGEIGINLFGEDCMACQPFYKLMKNDWLAWKQSIREFCEKGIVNVYAENALNVVLSRFDLHGLDLRGELCMEVDNRTDLDYIKYKIG